MAIGMAAGGRVAVPARVHERWPPGRGGPVRAGAHVWEPRASRERTRLSLFSNAAGGSLNKGDGNRTGRREWIGYRCRATHTHTGVHGSWSRRDRGGPGQPLRVSRPCRYRRPAVRPVGQETVAVPLPQQYKVNSSRSVAQDWPRVLFLSLY